jgi:hypothetical protein
MTLTLPTPTAMSAFVSQRWAPLPPLTTEALTYLRRPGIAEIKPHILERIRDGLKQLQDEVKTRPKGQDVVLLTYLYKSMETKPKVSIERRPSSSMEGKTRVAAGTGIKVPVAGKIKVFALRPKRELLEHKAKIPELDVKIPKNVRVSKWLGGLGTWYAVKDADLPSHSYRYWLTSLGPTGRGTAFEPAVRQAFIDTIKPKVHSTWVKFPSAKGADVVWSEVAEYLYELAGELADGR